MRHVARKGDKDSHIKSSHNNNRVETVRGKVVMCSFWHHTMKAYKGLEVQLHTLFNMGT